MFNYGTATWVAISLLLTVLIINLLLSEVFPKTNEWLKKLA